MEATKRRLEIEKRLVDSDIYLSCSELAKEFKVSRQVIVQDIAILRAKGIPILATPQGYIISKINEEGEFWVTICYSANPINLDTNQFLLNIRQIKQRIHKDPFDFEKVQQDHRYSN